MLLAADITKKRKKSNNSPGFDETETKRADTKMAQKSSTGQKQNKDKGLSQDSNGI